MSVSLDLNKDECMLSSLFHRLDRHFMKVFSLSALCALRRYVSK